MNSGDTKTEAMLNVLGNGGSGDQFRGCCNTKTQSYILDAIDRINNLDPGGGGSDFKKLTDADKNYTLDGEDYIAVWLLESGKYTLAEDITVPLLIDLVENEEEEETTIVGGDMWTAETLPNIIVGNGTGGEFSEVTIVSTQGVVYYSLDPSTHFIDDFDSIPEAVFTGTDGAQDGMKGLVPAPTTSDAGKFLSANGGWESAGGGTPVQTTGTSTTDVMSQDATTKLIHPDIVNHPTWVHIGAGSSLSSGLAINGSLSTDTTGSIVIGSNDNSAIIGQNGRARDCISIGDMSAVGKGSYSIAIGYNTYSNSGSNLTGRNTIIGADARINGEVTGAVSLGAYAKATRTGEVNIGTNGNNAGYNSTDYRVIGGVHDGQLAQDAATVAQVNATIDAINTALSTNIPHIGASS